MRVGLGILCGLLGPQGPTPDPETDPPQGPGLHQDRVWVFWLLKTAYPAGRFHKGRAPPTSDICLPLSGLLIVSSITLIRLTIKTIIVIGIITIIVYHYYYYLAVL